MSCPARRSGARERILADLFPGLVHDLVTRGAQRFSWFADGIWWQFDGYRVRHADDFEGTFSTRPLQVTAAVTRLQAPPAG
ncbi:MAG TPA: hypothetical protein VFV73_19085 [Streptosporangiaceae bacterium]|nr:hypothetical protein [Streptosporangiaceae bacterium]